MTLEKILSKLKTAKLKAAQWQFPDADRAGDWLLVLALTATAAVFLHQLLQPGHYYLPLQDGRIVFM